jgi:hypothetical protein
MINVIIAYDNRDANLGTYFEDCKNQILPILKRSNTELHEISSIKCNNAYIDFTIPKYNSKPFIFIAYSHGNESALCCNGNCYVEKDSNTHYFVNSLFYTTACSTGKRLGEDLINKGCLAFIGYGSNINVYYNQDVRKKTLMNCDNAGIVAFLSDDITIFEAYKKMKSYYSYHIDKLHETKDMLFAAELVEARDALVFLGKRDLKKETMTFIND